MKGDLERAEVLNLILWWSRLELKPVKSCFCSVAAPFHWLLRTHQPIRYAGEGGHLSLDLLVSKVKMVSFRCGSYRLVCALNNQKIWVMHSVLTFG